MGTIPSKTPPPPPPSTDITLNLIYYINAISQDTFSRIQDSYQRIYYFEYKLEPYNGPDANSVILSSITSKIQNIDILISTDTTEFISTEKTIPRSRLFNAQYGENNSLNNNNTKNTTLTKTLANGGQGAYIRPSSDEPYDDYLKRFYNNEYRLYDKNLCFQYKPLNETDKRWSNGIKIKLIEYDSKLKNKIKAEYYYFISISDIQTYSNNNSYNKKVTLKKI